MAEFTAKRTELIQAPVAAVYAYVSDFPRHTEWNHAPTEMTKLTDGSVDVGSVFRTKEQASSNQPRILRLIWPLLGKITGSAGYTEAEITALEPDRRVTWKATAPLKNGSLMARSEWEIHLEKRDEGILVTQSVHFEFLGKMGERINPETAAAQTGEEMGRNLARLKEIVQARTATENVSGRTAFPESQGT